MAKPVLGRGLGALLSGVPPAAKSLISPALPPPAASSDSAPAEQRERVQRVPIDRLRACPLQPRKDFSAEALQELADSIREQGIVQPLICRMQDGWFELIAGERRWRAAQLVGLKEVPVIVREADDATVLELALIENLQRENLNPIEEAQGFTQLIEQFKLSQEQAAAKVGKSRTVVANALRLLKLPADVQTHVRAGRLSVGHAKVILSLAQAAQQSQAAEQILKDGLNVRQTEELVAHWQSRAVASATAKAGVAPATPPVRDLHVADLENRLQQRLGTKVNLRYRKGRGAIEVRFFSDDELDRLLEIIGVKVE